MKAKKLRHGIAPHGRLSSTRPRRWTTCGVLAGAALGAVAILTHWRAKRAERDHPPTGRFLEIDGVRLHYFERGEGSPIVLLHGNGAVAEDFAISGVLDRLARNHRVIAFDRPGFGYSTRPRTTVWTPAAQAKLLLAAARRLGVEKPIVVGHSWGTLVALAMALDQSERVAGIVLLSGYYFPTPRIDALMFSPPAIPVVGDVMRYTISPLLGRMMAPGVIRRLFAPSQVTPRFAHEFPVSLALRPWQIRSLAADTALMIPAANALQHRYGELTMPVSIMAGADDRIVEAAQAERLCQAVPGSMLRIVEGAGHMVHHVAPELVAGAVEDLAAKCREEFRLRGSDSTADAAGMEVRLDLAQADGATDRSLI